MTVFIAVITSRSTATVDPIGPVALHLVWFVDKTVCTEEVGSFLRITMPVLGTVKQVWVPSVCLADADVGGVVVCGSAVSVGVAAFAVIRVAIIVALVAHLTVTAVDSIREVALDEVGVVQQLLSVHCVADHVGSVPS